MPWDVDEPDLLPRRKGGPREPEIDGQASSFLFRQPVRVDPREAQDQGGLAMVYVAGGGSLPGYAIPSAALVLNVPSADEAAAKLRLGRPSVFCRVDDGTLVFDLRTVRPEDDDRLARAIRYVLEQT